MILIEKNLDALNVKQLNIINSKTMENKNDLKPTTLGDAKNPNLPHPATFVGNTNGDKIEMKEQTKQDPNLVQDPRSFLEIIIDKQEMIIKELTEARNDKFVDAIAHAGAVVFKLKNLL